MEVLDAGHQYSLSSFDDGYPVLLTFVKRNDPPKKYPGNTHAYPGTQTQEVLRALIDRAIYVNGQIPCLETESVIALLRQSIALLEQRHARSHGVNFMEPTMPIEIAPFCKRCGHLMCFCED